MFHFTVQKTNKFDDVQYVECDNYTLSDTKVWVVKNPSPECARYLLATYPGSAMRTYSNKEYLLSKLALQSIPDKLEKSIIHISYKYMGTTQKLEYKFNETYSNKSSAMAKAIQMIYNELNITVEPCNITHRKEQSHIHEPIIEHDIPLTINHFIIDFDSRTIGNMIHNNNSVTWTRYL